MQRLILTIVILTVFLQAVRAQNVGIGISSPSEKLDVLGNVKVDGKIVIVPRNAPPSGTLGDIYVNSSDGKLYYHDATSWKEISIGNATEVDPVYSASPAAGITNTDIVNWNAAHSWGNHASAGYLTSYTETDPTFTASPAGGITTTNINNWNTAHGWGNHATAGYLTSYSEVDPQVGANTTNRVPRWNGSSLVTGTLYDNGSGIGIGTTAPAQSFHTTGNIRFDGRVAYFGSAQYLSGDNSSALYWRSNHSTITQMLFQDAQGLNYGRIYGGGNGELFGLMDRDGHWSILHDRDSYTEFRINNTARMRINSNGNVGIGTNNPQGKLHIFNGSTTDFIFKPNATPTVPVGGSTTAAIITNSGTGGTGAFHMGFEIPSNDAGDGFFILTDANSNGAVDKVALKINALGRAGYGTNNPLYTVHVIGNVNSTGGYFAVSDRQYKKDILELDNALDKVKSINGYSYNWKTEEFPEMEFDNTPQIGVLAQEVQEVLPELVHTDEEGNLAVNYSQMVPVLVEAMQEQQELIDENAGLKDRVELLEQEMAELKATIREAGKQ